MSDDRRWHLVVAMVYLTAALSLADVATTYAVPSEFYPLIGLILGAAIGRGK